MFSNNQEKTLFARSFENCENTNYQFLKKLVIGIGYQLPITNFS